MSHSYVSGVIDSADFKITLIFTIIIIDCLIDITSQICKLAVLKIKEVVLNIFEVVQSLHELKLCGGHVHIKYVIIHQVVLVFIHIFVNIN